MIRTEARSSVNAMSSHEDEAFEEVRQSFLIRLHDEQIRLMALADALGSGGENAVSSLCALEVFAHRLRGAAAVFDAAVLSEDARSLELAVAAASIEPRIDNDPLVWSALRTLISRLASMNGNPPPPDCAVPMAQ